MPNTLTEKIITLFEKNGDSEYGGEAVTQGEHALQAAHLAIEEGCNSNIIVASLLHDIGHMLHALPDDAPNQGIDDLHEELGFRFVDKYFKHAVAEPVRLHVAAKRYLCAKEPDYLGRLSEPSIISLHLQGGPMTEAECRLFEQNPFYRDAVQVRRFDDLAKVPNMEVRPLRSYEEIIAGLLK
jgi:[1-hydroxy-2-(trimethylamino)ethyl]phosphonate dioxygenase